MNPTMGPHSRSITKKQLFFFFILSVGTFTFLLAGTYVFTLRNIYIEGATDIRGVERQVGRSLPFVSTDQVAKDITSDNPKIMDITITKSYPNSMNVFVTLKRPSVQVKLADGYIIIAPDGFILKKTKDKPDDSVPLIQYYQPLFYNQYRVGSLLDNRDIQTTSSFSRSLQSMGIKVASIDIASENMIVLHTEKFDVFTTSEKDIEQQFLEFEYTYKQLNREGKEFSSIDVRFEKPVIKLL